MRPWRSTITVTTNFLNHVLLQKMEFLNKSGRMLKKIYSIDRQVKNTSMNKQIISSGHKKNMSYNYAPRNNREVNSRSLTQSNFMSNRYTRKSISSSKLAKINEQVQSFIYPDSKSSQ